jgi:endogenous inhibitor of DNA gyrase (YacG/DUF329 family)
MIDLGTWLEEGYTIPGEGGNSDDGDEKFDIPHMPHEE